MQPRTRTSLRSCLILALLVSPCGYAVIAPTLVPGRVRSSIHAGMSLRQVLEQNRERLDCGLTIADARSASVVLVEGRVSSGGGRLRYASDGPHRRESFDEVLTRIEAEVAAVTTSTGWQVTLKYSPHVDVYQYVRFELDPSGVVRSVAAER